MSRRRLRNSLLLSLPLLVFFGLYLRSLDYDFVWTDQGEIEHGILLRPPGRVLEAFWQPMHPNLERLSPGAAQPYYRPLQVILVSSIHNEFGKQPRYFRAAGLALGAATVVLFTAFVWLLAGDLRAAALAGAVCAAHPAAIENYVWIAGLSAALVKFFIVSSLLAAQLALQVRAAALRGAMLLLSAMALLLGLLSKEDAVVTPALLLTCIASLAVVRRRDDPERTSPPSFFSSSWKTAAALLLAHGLITAAFAFWWRPQMLGGGVLTGASPIGGSPAVHGLTALATWPYSLAWLFLPLQSTTSDVVRIVNHVFDPMAWIGALLAPISLAAWLRLLRRGQAVPALGLAWIWIAFLPTSGLVPLTHARADRYLALSVFGSALIWSALIPELARFAQPKARRLLAPALAVVLVLGLAQRTWVRVPDWRSDIELFERDVRRDPLFREGYYVLAVAHVEEGRLKEAKRWLEALKDVGPRFSGLWSFLRATDASVLLCRVNLGLGQGGETLEAFKGQLRADSDQLPRMAELFVCGAYSLEQAGRPEEALEILVRLRDLNPTSPDPRLTLAIARCHARLGQRSEAQAWLDRLPSEASRDPQLRWSIAEVRGMIRSAASPR
jgi:tetratricopeptide (TPR) repeat protein